MVNHRYRYTQSDQCNSIISANESLGHRLKRGQKTVTRATLCCAGLYQAPTAIEILKSLRWQAVCCWILNNVFKLSLKTVITCYKDALIRGDTSRALGCWILCFNSLFVCVFSTTIVITNICIITMFRLFCMTPVVVLKRVVIGPPAVCLHQVDSPGRLFWKHCRIRASPATTEPAQQ